MTDKPAAETIEATSTTTKTKEQILADVYSLATLFSTCVEAFNLIHPNKDTDHAQKVALAKLGLQQGRLLIFGDAVGISAPPPTIATHMIPTHPGITNPDPHLPVNFGVRDARLDDEAANARIRRGLHELTDRPSNVSREELMSVYGLKKPKAFNKNEQPALDTNRLEGFREKYALLGDLMRSSGTRANMKRNASMTTSHWTVKDSTRFSQFVKSVRIEVDTLIDFMGVKEQVDRGIRSDIRCMAWHPDLSGPIVRSDWEKLKLIREACAVDYPEYIEVVDTALAYINEELREKHMADRRGNYGLPDPNVGTPGARRKSDYDIRSVTPELARTPEKTSLRVTREASPDTKGRKESHSGWMSAFRIKSFSKSSRPEKPRSGSHLGPDKPIEPNRSQSESEAVPPDQHPDESNNRLEPIRSKSLSAIPDAPALDMDSRMRGLSINSNSSSRPDPIVFHEDGRIIKDFAPINYSADRSSIDANTLSKSDTASSGGRSGSPMGSPLYGATTHNSLIERHDQFHGIGRVETRDIRQIAHETDLTG